MIAKSIDGLNEGSVQLAATLFRAFSDPSRLKILQHLMLGPHRVVDLTAHLHLAQSTVSAHLACLRDCGLIVSEPKGRASQWSLSVPAQLMQLLAAADEILTETHGAVAFCPAINNSFKE